MPSSFALNGVTCTGGVSTPTPTVTPPPSSNQPCDIYASGGTPCVAAHSTTRALYASYNGSLYQVRRSSD
ncbi:arabinofuranosidase catalytic domain-containing protein, partial [Nonomuraea angiospora]